MTNITFELGQKVKFTEVLSRMNYMGKKVWAPVPIEGEGLVMGKRTLANGHVKTYEYGRYFVGEHYFTAYLVAYDMKRKPEWVREDGMEVL